jgi:hypothetical protein
MTGIQGEQEHSRDSKGFKDFDSKGFMDSRGFSGRVESVRLVRIQGWRSRGGYSRRWYKPLWGTAHQTHTDAGNLWGTNQ